MKNITIIYGQNHLGSTYHIAKGLALKITNEENITEFFLPRDLNHFCLGCYQCIEDVAKCPYYDEKKVILDAMEKSDIFIFATPNYCFGASAQMKAMIDLFFDYWLAHRPLPFMFEKKAVVISTSAGAGHKKAANQVKQALIYMGVPYVKTYALAVQAMNWHMVSEKKKAKIENDITKLSQKILKINVKKRSIKSKFLFSMFKNMHSAGFDSSPVEKEYWIENGWIKNK